MRRPTIESRHQFVLGRCVDCNVTIDKADHDRCEKNE